MQTRFFSNRGRRGRCRSRVGVGPAQHTAATATPAVVLTPRRESCDPPTGWSEGAHAQGVGPPAPLPAPHAGSSRQARAPERVGCGRRLAAAGSAIQGSPRAGAPPARDKRKTPARRPSSAGRGPAPPSRFLVSIPSAARPARPQSPRAFPPVSPRALRPGHALPPNPKVAFRAAR